MRLTALLISNFKGISDEIKVLIDNIVVLVGPNNCCKSTVLDAYEAYCSLGSSLTLDFFHGREAKTPIVLTGIFKDITQGDIDLIGQEWVLESDPEYGRCAKFQIRWTEPDTSGNKYSFSSDTNDWKEGGAGGWNSLLQSRLPYPIRINPNDNTEKLEKILKDLIAKSALQKIKDDKGKLATIIAEIEKLAKEVETEISTDIANLNTKIEMEIQKLFDNLKVGFETGVGKFKPEEAIKDGSRFILDSYGSSAPLGHQGSGIQRAFLWSAINALCSEGRYKQGPSKTLEIDKPKILLLDEPEINLHPSVIRAARKAIYSLSEIDGWQVMCTTHSPIFIDLTFDHTTLIRVSNTPNGVYYFQTDKSSFSPEEKANLKMLNRCCPTVNEFFFYDNSILVEGDTEFLAFHNLIEREKLEGRYCVINCRGKANIPTFIKIFNQFKASAIAIHDLDTKLNKKGAINAMWTLNFKIREEADNAGGRVTTVVHDPDFEGFYLNESPPKDKPYNLFMHLTSPTFDTEMKYENLRSALKNIIEGSHPGIYKSADQLEALA